jgi:hypothetical protein
MGTDSQFAALLVLGRHPSNLHSAAEPTRAATPQTINRNPATERSLSGSSAADETATRHSQSGKWTSTPLLLGACDQDMGGGGGSVMGSYRTRGWRLPGLKSMDDVSPRGQSISPLKGHNVRLHRRKVAPSIHV